MNCKIHWGEYPWEGAGKMSRKPGDLPVVFCTEPSGERGSTLWKIENPTFHFRKVGLLF